MKKITSFFAIALMSIGAAYSQTLTVEQFEKEKGNFQDKEVTLTQAGLQLIQKGNGTCAALNPDQMAIQISALNAKTPSTTCFKLNKTDIARLGKSPNGRFAVKQISVKGNEKDGYTVTKFVGAAPAR